jgi:hypothetical protein
MIKDDIFNFNLVNCCVYVCMKLNLFFLSTYDSHVQKCSYYLYKQA